MSKKERERKVLMEEVDKGRISLREASVRLKVSYRQSRRIRKRYKAKGDAGLVHASRGRKSNRGKAEKEKKRAVERYRERYEGFGPTLASEKLKAEGMEVDHETLRRWLMADGSWVRKSRKLRFRESRPRRERFGELVQMDGSHHRWFGPERGMSCLVNLVDDATTESLPLMDEEETTSAAMRSLWQWIERYGVPQSLYTDKKNVYVTHREPSVEEELSGELPVTAFGLSCRKLGIRIVTAHSPQAKGRVERNHAVYQDRLVKEMRLRRITTVAGANRLLAEGFVDDLNRKFAIRPKSEVDAHRPVPKDCDLREVFCWEETRRSNNDFTVRHNNAWYQITRDNQPLPRPGSSITVRRRLDDSLSLLYKDRPLRFVKLSAKPPKETPVAQPRTIHRRSHKPSPDHPWKRYPAGSKPIAVA